MVNTEKTTKDFHSYLPIFLCPVLQMFYVVPCNGTKQQVIMTRNLVSTRQNLSSGFPKKARLKPVSSDTETD